MLEPACDANVPARHVVQDRLLEEGLKDPAGHSEQTAGLLPSFKRTVPGLQSNAEQLTEP